MSLTVMVESLQYKHFCNRAAFGIPLSAVKNSFQPLAIMKEGVADKPIQVIEKPVRDYEGKPNEAEIKVALKKNKEAQIRLNTAWFNQLTDPQVVFREKMTFFWHDHFACRTRNAFLAQQQNNTLRKYALGKFGDLLMAVSKDPAMLQFLNNQQNRKDKPNENFAREVMELFTLGRGNYTESDIKNAARAFTGWAFNPLTGEYLFRSRQHDFDSKTFRGKTGNFSGEDIIQMILGDKQTAFFITHKICKFFAGEAIEKSEVDALAEKFFKSDYDINQLLINLYSSDWFYKNSGNRIKSPVELIAGVQVQTGGNFNNPFNIIFLQKTLGQVLFQPPNVGGWPAGKEWIDSSSLTFRMSLPTLLLRNAESSFQAKDDGDVNDATNTVAKPGQISYTVNWEKLAGSFRKNSADKTLEEVEGFLLVKPTTEENRKMIAAFAGEAKEDLEFLKKACIGFMSLPEYQLS
ncbi:MAG TPA: DUF1800 domain-containing protein [Cyclobacteriaceae bacterium]|nr:DUF1800 domain-containing protein [Cyclobacteriaceae bacterium]